MNRFWSLLLLLLVSFLGTLWLETGMQQHFMFELYVLLVGLILAIIFIYGLAAGRDWAVALGVIIFAASLANIAFVYFSSRTSIVGFAVVAIFSVLGIILSAGVSPESLAEPAPQSTSSRASSSRASSRKSKKASSSKRKKSKKKAGRKRKR